MPEHVHMLLTPRMDQTGAPYSIPEIMQSIKGVSAHRINKLLRRQGPVWQQESFDHVPRRAQSVNVRVEYVRQNPVRRGLANKPEEYRWLWVKPGLR